MRVLAMNHRPDDLATDHCRRGVHADPDNEGWCIHCLVILSPEPNEDPNASRRRYGWPDVPVMPEGEDDQ